MNKPKPAPPAYFDADQAAAWNELADACGGRLDSTADRIRAEQAALLLAEMRAAPELFQTARHAQLRLMLADLLPPTDRPAAPADDWQSALAAELESQAQAARAQRRTRRRSP